MEGAQNSPPASGMASSPGSDSEGSDERAPLWPGLPARRPTATILHKDSVFSLVLFVPPLTRKKEGHYCTVPVVISLLLFAVTVTCQLSLTLIAGDYIREQSSSFKVSLIHHQDFLTTALTPVDYLRDKVVHAGQKIAWSSPKVEECCNSAECIELYPCCGAVENEFNTKGEATENSAKFLAGQSVRRAPELNVSRVKNILNSFAFGSSGGAAAVCRKGSDGIMDCSPPSYAYLDAWHELDHNGDGAWTREEAEADRTNLGCRLGLSAKEFFNSAIRGIIKDARDTADNSYAIPLVPQSIEKRESIPIEYFEHFKGLVVVCTAFDMGRCGQLIKEGIFDGAFGLKSKATRGGIHDLDSSLDFCQRMLRPNGICDQVLPHTYQIYRSRTHEKCGAPSFQVGAKYINPYDQRDAMSIVDVSYGAYDQYVLGNQWRFQIFLAFILLIWYLTLVLELYRVIELVDMLINFKKADRSSHSLLSRSELWLPSSNSFVDMQATLSLKTHDDDEKLIIEDLSHTHRIMCTIMVIIRIYLWFYMANVGTVFLLATFAYDDLLFDCVTLAFIFELPEFLYAFLISEELKDELRGAETTPFPTSLPQAGWKSNLMSRAVWGLLVIPLFVLLVCYYHCQNNIVLSLEALRCACYQAGPNCAAAYRFNPAWWDQYWKDTFALAKLRSSYLS